MWRRASLSVLLLFGLCLAGCPTRTVYDDGGDEGSSGGSGAQAGRSGSGGATNSGAHPGTAGGSAPATGGDGNPIASGAGGLTGTGGSSSTGGGAVLGTGGAAGSGSGATGGHGGTGAVGTGGSSTGGVTGTGGARGGASGMGGTGIAGKGGSGGGAGGAVAGHGGNAGTAGTGVVTCGGGRMNCSGTCVDLQTDVNHCGSCNAQPCAGMCQSGLCCTGGKTNCGGTCVDLSSDDKHCGACTGATIDCTQMAFVTAHCRSGVCRLADGAICKSDSDCLSGKCDVFYGDDDRDGYPTRAQSQRFCAFPAAQNPGDTTHWAPPRPDNKWDCCDSVSAVNPGATMPYPWGAATFSDPQCMVNPGDTNCDGTIEVNPADAGGGAVTGCQLNGTTCEPVIQPFTPTDCGKSFSGCSCSDTCTKACFTSFKVSCL